MPDSNNDRFGVSPQEYRELRVRFIEATTAKERAKIFNLLLNEKMYAEFAEFARRYKREKGRTPDINTISLVNNYLGDLLNWWYNDPAKIIRFEELSEFVAYSRKALQFALLAKLKPLKELTGQENTPEPERPDDVIAEIVGQDAFDKLIRQIRETLTPLERDIFLLRVLEGLTYPAIAARLSAQSVPSQTYAPDQIRMIYKRKALAKLRGALQSYWRENQN